MSRNQKAPLFAFVLVALVCGLVLVDSMRAESRNDHPLDVLSLSQLGPAYFLAPDADPIGRTDEVDGSTEASGLPLTPGSAPSSTPGTDGEDPTDSPGDETSAAVGDDSGLSIPDPIPSDDADEPADEPTEEGELFPPSVLPGVKDPFVSFTIFGPAGPPTEEPTDEPTEEPSEEPTTEAEPGGNESEPGDGGGSEGSDPGQDHPSDGASSESQPADPGSTP